MTAPFVEKTKYRLMTFENGELRKSYNFLNPAKDIYQIITDLGFSFYIDNNLPLVSKFDNNKIYLDNDGEIIEEFDIHKGEKSEKKLFIRGNRNKCNINFSTIYDKEKIYIYCPNLEFYN